MSNDRRRSLNVRVSDPLLDKLDEAWKEREFPNRSEFVRRVLRDAVYSESDLSQKARELTEEAVRAESVSLDEAIEELRDDQPQTLERDHISGRPPDRPLVDAIIESDIGYHDRSQADEIDIRVVGCGGGGVRLVDSLHQNEIHCASTLTIDTDREELQKGMTNDRALIGTADFHGQGAGGNVTAVSHVVDRIHGSLTELIGSPDLLFVVAGLGGGTGTALAPEIAKIGRQNGAVVVSVGTLPFSLEEKKRTRAQDGVERLRPVSDTTVLFDGNLVKTANESQSFSDALARMNEDVSKIVNRICEYLGEFYVGTDGLSLLTMLEDSGFSVMLRDSYGHHDEIVEQRLFDRLLSYSTVDLHANDIEQAILIFSAGENVNSSAIDGIVKHIQQWTDEVAWHATHTLSDPNRIEVTCLLTGVDLETGRLARRKKEQTDQGWDRETGKGDIEILNPVPETVAQYSTVVSPHRLKGPSVNAD